MAFDFSKYSFIGIQELCREHYKEIMQSHDSDNLKSILDNRRIDKPASRAFLIIT